MVSLPDVLGNLERYRPALLRFIASSYPAAFRRCFDPEDIFQEVALDVCRNHYDGSWPLLVNVAKHAVRNQVLRHRRQRRDVRRLISVELDEIPAKPTSTVTESELLEGLPQQLCDIIRLRMEGYEVSEVANELDLSQRTVERRLQWIRERTDFMNNIQYVPQPLAKVRMIVEDTVEEIDELHGIYQEKREKSAALFEQHARANGFIRGMVLAATGIDLGEKPLAKTDVIFVALGASVTYLEDHFHYIWPDGSAPKPCRRCGHGSETQEPASQ